MTGDCNDIIKHEMEIATFEKIKLQSSEKKQWQLQDMTIKIDIVIHYPLCVSYMSSKSG